LESLKKDDDDTLTYKEDFTMQVPVNDINKCPNGFRLWIQNTFQVQCDSVEELLDTVVKFRTMTVKDFLAKVLKI
jgi:hypothetical protein